MKSPGLVRLSVCPPLLEIGGQTDKRTMLSVCPACPIFGQNGQTDKRTTQGTDQGDASLPINYSIEASNGVEYVWKL